MAGSRFFGLVGWTAVAVACDGGGVGISGTTTPAGAVSTECQTLPPVWSDCDEAPAAESLAWCPAKAWPKLIAQRTQGAQPL
jgi:hypothetical protein